MSPKCLLRNDRLPWNDPLSYSSAHVRIIYEKTEEYILCDRHWPENKIYKLKRWIFILNLSRGVTKNCIA